MGVRKGGGDVSGRYKVECRIEIVIMMAGNISRVGQSPPFARIQSCASTMLGVISFGSDEVLIIRFVDLLSPFPRQQQKLESAFEWK